MVQVHIINCTMTENTATEGRGGALAFNGEGNIDGLLLTSNSATLGGGGMWIRGSSFEMTDIEASGNSASGPGGAILITNDGDLTLSSSTFTDNTPNDINVQQSTIEIISMSTVESLDCQSGTSNLDPSSTIDLVMCQCTCGGTACGCVEGANFDLDKNCSNCIDGFFGLECCAECTINCHGHGLCEGTASSTQPTTCVCDSNFDTSTNCRTCVLGFDLETECTQCESDFFGLNCQMCPDIECGGHGQCDDGLNGTGLCICELGFDQKSNCDDCESDLFGRDCQPCPNTECGGHGQCDDGVDGTGSCVCEGRFNPTTNCSTCVEGFDQENNCEDCEADFFGRDCQPCPDTECGGHGQCDDGVDGDGSCICEDGFNPDTNCESLIPSGVAITRVINNWILIPLVLFTLRAAS